MDKEKRIVCFVDMFSSYVSVYRPGVGREEIPTDGALQYLYEACNEENVYDLHLIGNEDYINGLVLQNPPLNYNCGKVHIRIN